ncbi:hypothetical protein [Chitinibacter sp. S2-10]|uniref:hypothetical protein n=1 Tax=Chitinibacter sp. S2-10 TaxID=3373597 RepID=UPI003977A945
MTQIQLNSLHLQISSDGLIKAGYKVTYISDCVAKVEYTNIKPFFAICSLPSVGPVPKIDGLAQTVTETL